MSNDIHTTGFHLAGLLASLDPGVHDVTVIDDVIRAAGIMKTGGQPTWLPTELGIDVLLRDAPSAYAVIMVLCAVLAPSENDEHTIALDDTFPERDELAKNTEGMPVRFITIRRDDQAEHDLGE